jgi:hypothetical protein
MYDVIMDVHITKTKRYKCASLGLKEGGESFVTSLIYFRFRISQATKSRDSSVWTIRVLGFDFRRGLASFLFTTASKTALGPHSASCPMGTGALSLRVKRPGREADHSPPSSAKVKE